jgi:hypothetical protein
MVFNIIFVTIAWFILTCLFCRTWYKHGIEKGKEFAIDAILKEGFHNCNNCIHKYEWNGDIEF